MSRGGNGRFLPGNNGGPGRPKGSRNKLSEEFLAALFDDFEQGGIEAIRKTREEQPAVYVRVIASLLPKDVNVNSDADAFTRMWQAISDGELDERIRQLADAANLEIAPKAPH